MKRPDPILAAIAREHLFIPTLETRRADSLDFHDVAVWQVEAALKAAFDAGKNARSLDTIDLEINEAKFEEQFPLVRNHLNPNATWGSGEPGDCLFETYGEELAFVQSQDPRYVWTFMDGDDGQYVASGFHFVNRIGYLISTVPLPDGVFIEVPIPSASDDDGADIDIHKLLDTRRQVAVIWSIEDVQEMRRDLDEEQSWQVLQRCRKVHDCEVGFNWLLIETVADDLFPEPSDD
jgi:hypothetical protein